MAKDKEYYARLAARRLLHIQLQEATIKGQRAQLNRYPNLWRLECGHYQEVPGGKWNVPNFVCPTCQTEKKLEAALRLIEEFKDILL